LNNTGVDLEVNGDIGVQHGFCCYLWLHTW